MDEVMLLIFGFAGGLIGGAMGSHQSTSAWKGVLVALVFMLSGTAGNIIIIVIYPDMEAGVVDYVITFVIGVICASLVSSLLRIQRRSVVTIAIGTILGVAITGFVAGLVSGPQ